MADRGEHDLDVGIQEMHWGQEGWTRAHMSGTGRNEGISTYDSACLDIKHGPAYDEGDMKMHGSVRNKWSAEVLFRRLMGDLPPDNFPKSGRGMP